MEGRWVRKIFAEICEKDSLNQSHAARLLEMLDKVNDIYEGLGLCLSECGDSLSQWRGYAQDAEGFCVGFSKEGLHALSELFRDSKKPSFELTKVNYDVHAQRKELEPTYREIKNLIEKGAFRFPSLLTLAETEDERQKDSAKQKQTFLSVAVHLLTLAPILFRQKNPAFAEEKEWRLISPFGKLTDDDIEFRSAGHRLIPYRPFEFQPEIGIIKEVILGPKNQTPVDITQIALKKFGYEGVSVRKSEATYR